MRVLKANSPLPAGLHLHFPLPRGEGKFLLAALGLEKLGEGISAPPAETSPHPAALGPRRAKLRNLSPRERKRYPTRFFHRR